MSNSYAVGAVVMIFVVAALLYYQAHVIEGFNVPQGGLPFFKNAWSTWDPSKTPLAGRLYDPLVLANNTYPVPADLSRMPIAQPYGTLPLSQQRPNQTPGPGTGPREALAQLKDLYELDNKIMTWLDAASQKDRDQPGSLTEDQLQERVMLQSRLAEVRDELGTGMIIDTWKKVADEILELRRENQGWQEMSPSLESLYGFGRGSNPNEFLTNMQYLEFYGLFNAAIQELEGLVQQNPLQKVRLQQLQVMRQDLMDNAQRMGTPPIKMGAAQLYLRQMLQADQPLPTLYSIDAPCLKPEDRLENNPNDVLNDLRGLMRQRPGNEKVSDMFQIVISGQMKPDEGRRRVASMWQDHDLHPKEDEEDRILDKGGYNPKNRVKRAAVLCKQIAEAFPMDVEALGCMSKVNTEFEADTVINTVCDRLRYSVPSVSPEQFNCP